MTLHRDKDIAARVREMTGGAGVPVIFDSVGKAFWKVYASTFETRQLYPNKVSAILRSGSIKAEIGQRFPQEAVAEVREELEAGTTIGSTVPIP